MSRFRVRNLSLDGLKLIHFKPHRDDRGSLSRLFCAKELSSLWPHALIQVNHTFTLEKGTIRGLHFQRPPYSEQKLVICLRGEVWDVAVDLRAGSPTLLQWHSEILSPEKDNALLIPEGFAHGFQTRSPNVEMLYFHSVAYSAEWEAGLSPIDPKLSISWPEPLCSISVRDQSHPLLDDYFKGLVL